MTDAELRDELREAQRALHGVRLQLARYGVAAPVHLTMEEEDLALKVAQLQVALGLDLTEPRELPRVVPPHIFEERQHARQAGERQRDVEHHQTLLSTYRRNLSILRAQAQAHGGWQFAPFHVKNQMDEARREIARLKGVLRSFYGIAVHDLAGDE